MDPSEEPPLPPANTRPPGPHVRRGLGGVVVKSDAAAESTSQTEEWSEDNGYLKLRNQEHAVVDGQKRGERVEREVNALQAEARLSRAVYLYEQQKRRAQLRNAQANISSSNSSSPNAARGRSSSPIPAGSHTRHISRERSRPLAPDASPPPFSASEDVSPPNRAMATSSTTASSPSSRKSFLHTRKGDLEEGGTSVVSGLPKDNSKGGTARRLEFGAGSKMAGHMGFPKRRPSSPRAAFDVSIPSEPAGVTASGERSTGAFNDRGGGVHEAPPPGRSLWNSPLPTTDVWCRGEGGTSKCITQFAVRFLAVISGWGLACLLFCVIYRKRLPVRPTPIQVIYCLQWQILAAAPVAIAFCITQTFLWLIVPKSLGRGPRDPTVDAALEFWPTVDWDLVGSTSVYPLERDASGMERMRCVALRMQQTVAILVWQVVVLSMSLLGLSTYLDDYTLRIIPAAVLVWWIGNAIAILGHTCRLVPHECDESPQGESLYVRLGQGDNAGASSHPAGASPASNVVKCQWLRVVCRYVRRAGGVMVLVGQAAALLVVGGAGVAALRFFVDPPDIFSPPMSSSSSNG